MIAGLDLPDGFGPIDETETRENNTDENDANSSFYYYDTMCNGSATLQFLQNGRTGAIFQKTKEEALQEYCRILSKSIITSNLGGSIAQIYLKTNQTWTADSSLPLPWSEVEPFPVLLVIGINPGFDCLDEHRELARTVLQTACADKRRVVGLCATLDYSTGESNSRVAQFARVRCTCEIAMEADIPLQLKLIPGPVLRAENQEDVVSPYSQILEDLCTILETYPTVKVHLCSWTGLSDDMMALLRQFPNRLWFGLDGSVTFAKAVAAHECAFDIPLDRLLLETGSNIPTPVAIALGRQAFPHSGLIPHVAAAVAKYKRNVSARHIARAASHNANELYQLMKHTDMIKHTTCSTGQK
ncbi:TatD related DNase [Fragilaria crotonensis]|nr:TatD related DNase [Fragilaria crotonensis]